MLLATSILGLVWNLCALPDVRAAERIEGRCRSSTAIGFSALGFLPAVVVHSVLRGDRDGRRGARKRAVPTAAYTVSAGRRAAPVRGGVAGPGRFRRASAMRLLTYAFIALVVPLVAVTRGQPGARRALWVAALAVFRGLGAASQPDCIGERRLAGGARRPSRLAAPRLRDPLPGLPFRARRSVPEAGARAARHS